jgi:hypothetical protein
MQHAPFKAGALALAALPVLCGCTPSVASLSCGEIADQAKDTSQGQPYKITAIANVRETSRNETEARCTGDATWSDGANSQVYLRAYKNGDNTLIGYQDAPFN